MEEIFEKIKQLKEDWFKVKKLADTDETEWTTQLPHFSFTKIDEIVKILCDYLDNIQCPNGFESDFRLACDLTLPVLSQALEYIKNIIDGQRDQLSDLVNSLNQLLVCFSNLKAIVKLGDTLSQAFKFVETTQTEMKNKLEKAEKTSTTIEDSLKRVVEAENTSIIKKDGIESIGTSVETVKSKSDELATTIETLKAQAEKDAVTTGDLATKAKHIEDKLNEYEKNLRKLGDKSDQLLKKIETILQPGATSVGLAWSFQTRKKEISTSKKRWGWVFCATIPFLVAASFLSPSGIVDFSQITTWSLVGLYVTQRLPITGPLVWLALKAGRHYWIASRLEEDYAYKEAISMSFEGYRKAMKTIGEDPDQSRPLITLCNDVLKMLAKSPGRIYDKKYYAITLFDAIKDAIWVQTNKEKSK